jgi:hypothetical protein
MIPPSFQELTSVSNSRQIQTATHGVKERSLIMSVYLLSVGDRDPEFHIVRMLRESGDILHATSCEHQSVSRELIPRDELIYSEQIKRIHGCGINLCRYRDQTPQLLGRKMNDYSSGYIHFVKRQVLRNFVNTVKYIPLYESAKTIWTLEYTGTAGKIDDPVHLAWMIVLCRMFCHNPDLILSCNIKFCGSKSECHF